VSDKQYVIFALEIAATGLAVNAYVVDCDVDAHDGQGHCDLTEYLDKARRFDQFSEAIQYLKRQSTVCPLRFDGRPNRPLTAFTCAIKPVPHG
jgi:hypothetical protein